MPETAPRPTPADEKSSRPPLPEESAVPIVAAESAPPPQAAAGKAAAGAAICAVGVLAAYLLHRQKAAPPSPPSPVIVAPTAPTAPPVPKDESRPAATFAQAPRVLLTIPLPSALQPPDTKGPMWEFEGVVFDLLSSSGVFAANLFFRDADGNIAGETSTGSDGNYKVVLPAGGPKGYSLKIIHRDYSERYIDGGGSTGSGVLNLPWVGVPKRPVRRNLGLVPRAHEKP